MTRHRRGSNAVEFAILLPILLVLASGVVDLAQLMLVSESATEAVADGAQAGALAKTPATPITTAKTVAANAFSTSSAQGHLTVVAATSTVQGMSVLTVTGTVTFTPLFGLLSLPSSVTVTNAMRIAD